MSKRILTGTPSTASSEALAVRVFSQSQRQRRQTAGTHLARVRALAADPHLHALAALVEAAHQRDHRIGGRPRHYPDWCFVLFGGCIRIFGSASATARALADSLVWNEIKRAAGEVLPQASSVRLPEFGPTRDHWNYFLAQRITAEVLGDLVAAQRDLGVARASEVGLLDAVHRSSPGKYHRDHVVSLDGKVFSSPVATLETERLNRRTGELIPVRQDPARQRYGEGGVEGIVYGTKFAIASTRSPLANHRVTLGIAHFDAATKGGEGRVFTDLALDLASRTSGIHAFTADGAWRGVHLNDVQSQTGCGVIAPPRHRAARNGGIVVDNRGHAAQPLPWSQRRIRREANCAGHSLWAAAGTLFEQIVTASGESEFRELTRHQTKRDKTRRKDGSERHQFYGRYSLPCPGHPDHDWWEPLLATAADEVARFNRCEYLRIAPTTRENHRRLYGMRQDSESLNAQLERAFYGQRLPAWGIKNQTTVVLFAAIADNAWTRQVWRWEAERQRFDPPAA